MNIKIYSTKIVNYLQEAKKPVTAQEVQSKTGLPLPVVTMSLQGRTRSTDQDIKRQEHEDGTITYEYIGVPSDLSQKTEQKPLNH